MTLASLGAIGTSVPVVATSCNNDNSNKVSQVAKDAEKESATNVVIVPEEQDVETPTYGNLYAKAYDKEGKEVTNAGIKYNIDQTDRPSWLTSVTVTDKGEIKLTYDSTSLVDPGVYSWNTKWNAESNGIKSPAYDISFDCYQVVKGNGFTYVNDKGEIVLATMPTSIDVSIFSDTKKPFTYNQNDETITLPIMPSNSTNAEPVLTAIPSNSILSMQLQTLADKDGGFALIPNNFMKNCANMLYIDLTGFSNTLSPETFNGIGDCFLEGCKDLTYIYSSLPKITLVGTRFLNGCESLLDIDLSPLQNVTIIQNFFLAGCLSLKSIDLSPLTKLTSIGEYFLYNTKNLQTIDLSPMAALTQIGKHFINKSGINTITGFDKLSKVSKLEYNALNNLPNLETVSIKGLGSEATIPEGSYLIGGELLYDVPNLKSVDFGAITLDKLDYPSYGSLSQKNKTDPAYVDGIEIIGDDSNGLIEKRLWPKDTYPYRNVYARENK